MESTSIRDCHGNFNRANEIVKLLTLLESFKGLYFQIIFAEGNTEVDRMHLNGNINHQHVFYDIFGNSLVFGNNKVVKLDTVSRLEKYYNHEGVRLRLVYTENKILKQVVFLYRK